MSRRDQLFRLLFPEHYATVKRAAEVETEYKRKFSSWQRSPLDESKWVAKFVALEGDYKALEKEVGELRVENWSLRRRVQKLLESI